LLWPLNVAIALIIKPFKIATSFSESFPGFLIFSPPVVVRGERPSPLREGEKMRKAGNEVVKIGFS